MRFESLLGAALLTLAACQPDAVETASPGGAAAPPVQTAPEAAAEALPEVIVLAGLEEHIAWLESENYWGEFDPAAATGVPRALMTGIPARWQETSATLPVAEKKELFYRYLLPLILHANDLVSRYRSHLEAAAETLAAGGTPEGEVLEEIRILAPLLRVRRAEDVAELPTGDDLALLVAELLYNFDVIPPGLALGQAAYESGYGTSRFAIEGNALFGQWTFGGEGLVPEQQRQSLGDHRIAAFDWPFDSVRAYFLNLNSHPAYAPFRELRAELRAQGRPLASSVLADGLVNYSERGQAYVDTLKGIIRVNDLELADQARFRDEPLRFVLGATDQREAELIRSELDTMRRTGELAEVIERMDLDLD